VRAAADLRRVTHRLRPGAPGALGTVASRPGEGTGGCARIPLTETGHVPDSSPHCG
jgi:hypothetical protein